jgi:hypothetical protein
VTLISIIRIGSSYEVTWLDETESLVEINCDCLKPYNPFDRRLYSPDGRDGEPQDQEQPLGVGTRLDLWHPVPDPQPLIRRAWGDRYYAFLYRPLPSCAVRDRGEEQRYRLGQCSCLLRFANGLLRNNAALDGSLATYHCRQHVARCD